MKISLLIFVIFSTTAFAIGTNDQTGSFAIEENSSDIETDARFLTGASIDSPDKSRMPASDKEEVQEISHVTELTGTFE